MRKAALTQASKPPRPLKAQTAEGQGHLAAETETPATFVTPQPPAISVAGAAGASLVSLGTWMPPYRYMPGVVTRPFTSEPAAVSDSPAWAPRSSSDDSLEFLASAVALA
jgi:hypothetical protein